MKKLAGIFLIIVFSITTLIGCNLFSEKVSTSESSKKIIDNVPYENKIINKVDKSVGNKEKVVDNSINNKSNVTNNNKQGLD